MRCCTNLAHNLSNVEVLGMEQQNLLLAEKKVIIDEALRGELCAFREVPATGPFLTQFDRIRSRCKHLVLDGASCTGNTLWARWIFGDQSNGPGSELCELP